MKRTSLLLFIALAIPGCAHVISEDTMKKIDSTISFEEVRKKTDGFIGKNVLLGGVVAGVKNSKEGGQLEIVQFPLDHTGFPIEVSRSYGRFIATSPDFLDSAIYKDGRLVTLAGEIKGQKTRMLDGAEYTYPIIGIKEIYAWKMDETERGLGSPDPSFYNNYNPYDFSHDVPLWYRPPGPVIRP